MDKRLERTENTAADLTRGATERSGRLYSKIASALRTEIESGLHPVGTLLPTEAVLRERFDVSRHTVREALRGLQELGLVARRQGFGTQVVSLSARANYVQSMRSLTELAQYARDTHFDIREVSPITISAEEGELIPAQAESRWIKIVGVRWTGDRTETICATTVYVHVRFAPLLHDVRVAQGPIYRLIEERSGEIIAETVQEISARALPRAIATALGVRTNAPALRFVRRYIDASGTPMVTSVNWHPGDRFVYRMRLKRDSADAY